MNLRWIRISFGRYHWISFEEIKESCIILKIRTASNIQRNTQSRESKGMSSSSEERNSPMQREEHINEEINLQDEQQEKDEDNVNSTNNIATNEQNNPDDLTLEDLIKNEKKSLYDKIKKQRQKVKPVEGSNPFNLTFSSLYIVLVNFNQRQDINFEDEQIDLRPEVLHVYGVDFLSTHNIMNYFDRFNPQKIEWLNDSSCNVVFPDEESVEGAVRALSLTIQDPNLPEEWKKGIPYKEKSIEFSLFFRLATTKDVKGENVTGKESLYYKYMRQKMEGQRVSRREMQDDRNSYKRRPNNNFRDNRYSSNNRRYDNEDRYQKRGRHQKKDSNDSYSSRLQRKSDDSPKKPHERNEEKRTSRSRSPKHANPIDRHQKSDDQNSLSPPNRQQRSLSQEIN